VREFFIKTMNEQQYLQDFLKKGQMFFRHAAEFRKIEDENVRGDKNEGSQKEIEIVSVSPSTKTILFGGNGGKKYIIDWDGVKKAHPEFANVTQPFCFDSNYVADIHLYCITYINSNTPDIDKVFEEISKFGKYSAVITNCAEFLEKVKKAIPAIQMDFVRYGEKGKTYSVFDKDKNYSYQNEFRIIKDSNGNKTSIIEIGKLSGFFCTSESLYTLKQFL